MSASRGPPLSHFLIEQLTDVVVRPHNIFFEPAVKTNRSTFWLFLLNHVFMTLHGAGDWIGAYVC